MSKKKLTEFVKCKRCQNYNKENDSCKIKKDMENCSKTDFSKNCDEFLISDKLVMF